MPIALPSFSTTASITGSTLISQADNQLNIFMTDVKNYMTNSYLTIESGLSTLTAQQVLLASQYANDSQDSATKASQWADNDFNVEVEVGKYSAKHWATVAENNAGVVLLTGNQTIGGVKTFSSTIAGSINGNSATATKLATARTIALSGDVNGNTSFDGSGNVTLVATVANDSHTHTFNNLTSKPTTLQGYGINPEELPASINLDTKTITGLYSQSQNSEATLALNYPIATAGVLEVFAYSSMIHQRYWAYNSNNVYYRAKYSSGAWTPWTKGANVDDTVAAAAALQTARTIALSGGATGTATSFDGTGNISIPVTGLNASNLSSGTVPDDRLSGVYSGMSLKLNGNNTVFTTESSGSANISRTVYGLAEYKNNSNSTTGAIVFIAPSSPNGTMHQLEVSGLLYNQNIVSLTVQGYITTGAWSDLRKISTGTVDIQVRWGVTPDGKNCLILGDIGTVWAYPHIAITRAMFSYNGLSDAYCTGWTVALVTSFTGYTNISANIGNSTMIGNVSSATKLQTARTINGVAFNGTANITVSDSTAVKLTGDQTIAGVKTFSSSPVVPTPTSGTHAVNMDYVSRVMASGGRDVYLGSYGLEWNETTDTYRRIGAENYTAIQSLMKRCVLNGDGSVKYYLDPNNSNYKEDGTLAKLDGTDGNVMVEVPKTYIRYEYNTTGGAGTDTIHRWEISLTPDTGFEVHWAFDREGVIRNKRYYPAYLGYVTGGKMISRSGVYPTVSQTLAQFRTAAKANSVSNPSTGQTANGYWGNIDFALYELITLYAVIEYGTMNIQSALGRGRTVLSGGNWIGGELIGINGLSNEYGNRTANYTYVGVSTDANADLSFMSYRGCENFFGNVWRMADGVIFKGTTLNKTMWYSTNPTGYNETGDGYVNSGIVTASASGYGRKLANTNKGFIVSDVTGGNSNAGTTDYYYISTTDNTVALVGGTSDDGLNAGPLDLDVDNSAASLSNANVGCGVSF